MTTVAKIRDLAWAAGIFDGEGCVSIGCVLPGGSKRLRNPSYRLTAKVTMGCRESVARFHRIVGTGTLQEHASRASRVNASWSWVAMARKAESALLLLRPHLFTKVLEVDVALEFMALPDVVRGGSHGSPPIDPELLAQKHALYERCAKLKPRYRFRKTPLAKFPH